MAVIFKRKPVTGPRPDDQKKPAMSLDDVLVSDDTVEITQLQSHDRAKETILPRAESLKKLCDSHKAKKSTEEHNSSGGGKRHMAETAELKKEVAGNWLDLLRCLSPDLEEACDRFPDHGPCPMHGGRDGFRLFDDAEDTGGGVCNTCGSFNDGIALLQAVNDWSFGKTINRIKRYLDDNGEGSNVHVVKNLQPRNAPAVRKAEGPVANQRTLDHIADVIERAEYGHQRIKDYYRSRGLSVEPSLNLGFVEEEDYFDREVGSITLPAMLALFRDVNGEPVAVFRTYLDPDSDGKAQVSLPKKCTPPVYKGATTGTAIRLHEAGEVLGIAEGIETAEAVHQATGTPMWATCAANRLEKVQIPSTVKEVHVWGDYDSTGAGQLAASKLADRLVGEGFRVKLLLPPDVDTDWLDVLVESGEEVLRGALASVPFVDLTAQEQPPRANAALEEVSPPNIFASIQAREGDPIDLLNFRHFVVPIGGKTYIATEASDPKTGYISMELGGVSDLSLRYSNWTKRVNGKDVPVAHIWLNSESRREYDGVIFAPGSSVPGFYNLWRGFAVEPRQGGCDLFWQHVRTVICGGNEHHYSYLRKWLAHLVQNPAELPGVAIVVRGIQGTGKTLFSDTVGKLFGQHYLMLTRIEQLTGRFTGHLKDVLLICANEAVWGGDKQGEGALKSLITDPLCPIESKGKDLYQVRNFKRLIVTSNEQWAVPMDMLDRRFLVLEASDAHLGDRQYFTALATQMSEEGGLEALLFDLMHEDLTGFDVRTKPHSHHGFDIKMRSAEPIVRWWHEVLYSGVLRRSLDTLDDPEDWYQTPLKASLHRQFLAYCETHRQRTIGLPAFGKELRKLLPGCVIGETRPTGEGHRPWCYKLPNLLECREAFERFAKADSSIWT